MITKTINYTDYNGNNRSEKFYFNLTDFEATEIAVCIPDGVVEEITNEDNDRITMATHLLDTLGKPGVVKFIKDLVLKSYGIKAPDGRGFIKNDEVRTKFEQSPAFSVLMMNLLHDDKEAAAFISGVIPKGANTNLVKAQSDTVVTEFPATTKENDY